MVVSAVALPYRSCPVQTRVQTFPACASSSPCQSSSLLLLIIFWKLPHRVEHVLTVFPLCDVSRDVLSCVRCIVLLNSASMHTKNCWNRFRLSTGMSHPHAELRRDMDYARLRQASKPKHHFAETPCVCSRRQRIRSLPGRLGYALMRGGEDGMTPAELRALPIVIHEASGTDHSHRSGSGDEGTFPASQSAGVASLVLEVSAAPECVHHRVRTTRLSCCNAQAGHTWVLAVHPVICKHEAGMQFCLPSRTPAGLASCCLAVHCPPSR